MATELDIYDARERRLVRLADLGLAALTLPARWQRPGAPAPPDRVLLLRLERIGDLLMSLGAIRAVRRLAPHAEITLVVGSWNESLARLVPGVDRIETLDAPWLTRDTRAPAVSALGRRAVAWRGRRFHLSLNFEGDLRSHLLPWIAGTARRVGFAMAGGSPLLTDVVEHDSSRHTALNGLALVERAFDLPAGSLPGPADPAATGDWRLTLPVEARAAAGASLGDIPQGQPLIAVHPGGGRAVKQWHPARFAQAAGELAHELGAAVLLTGSDDDRPVIDAVAAALVARSVPLVRPVGSADLVVLAALLERCRLLVTGDTGPMHLAAAVGTPVVAVFGPSMPWRYAPLPVAHRIVRVDLPCSPCNRIRRPPARCQGHVPDCLEGVSAAAVLHAARALLADERTAGR